jgi:hypothetical protein
MDMTFFLNRLRSRHRVANQVGFPSLAAEIKALLTDLEDGNITLDAARKHWRTQLEDRYLDMSRGKEDA